MLLGGAELHGALWMPHYLGSSIYPHSGLVVLSL